jgi:uncharacterized protein (DUF1015 family)
MAVIRPFKGFRPRRDLVKEVASPPYDVVNTQEAKELAQGNPHSFLHVVRSEIDLPEDTNPYDASVYLKAKENLDNLVKEGILVQDAKPCLYVYAQQMGSHKQFGIVACASVEDYQNDIIKKHELTRADKENDRIRHVDTLNANTGPVFLTYPADREIDTLVGEITQKEAEYEFAAEDGVIHTMWPVSDPDIISFIEGRFAKMPALYVADGHHRSASAAKVGQMRKETNPNHNGSEEYNFFLAVYFPHDQLAILDYNRVVKDLNGLTEEEFVTKIGSSFKVEETPQNERYKPSVKHTFGMYLKGKWYKLSPLAGTFDENHPVKSLDVSILQENLLNPILGIKDPRSDKRIDFVGGIRGMKELEKRVDAGEAVAFAFYPTSIEDLMDIADSGDIMPPKSTWFEPKLKSGLVIHFLD